MSVFSFALKEKNADLTEEEPLKDDNDIFKHIWSIYGVINNRDSNYREELESILKNIDPSKYGFVAWVLNHNLLYNKFTRKHLEMFTLVSNTFLLPEEYIYFYVRYMVKSGIQFPRFMPWYKVSIEQDDKRYREIVKEEFNLDNDELEDVLEYLRTSGVSLRDLVLNLL